MSVPVHFQINWIPDIRKWRMFVKSKVDSSGLTVEMENLAFRRLVFYAATASSGKPANQHENMKVTIIGPDEILWEFYNSREVIEGQHRLGVKRIEIDETVRLNLILAQVKNMLEYMLKLVEYNPDECHDQTSFEN